MTAKFYYKNTEAPVPNKPIHVGVCILIRMGDKMLFELRTDSDRWALIGGGAEASESLQQAALRELEEETGIIAEIDDLEMSGMFTDPSRIISYPDGNVFRVITYLFHMEVNPGQISGMRVSSESKQLKFVDIDQVHNLDIVETHRHILVSYFDREPGSFIFE